MNLNECKGSFLFKPPSSSSRSFIPNTAHQYTEFQISNFLESSVSWEKTLIFLVLWDLRFKQILITKPKEAKSPQSEL